MERGASQAEVHQAIEKGIREPAKKDRELCRFNFEYEEHWQGTYYAVKQVAPVIKETAEEVVVVTVYTFYF